MKLDALWIQERTARKAIRIELNKKEWVFYVYLSEKKKPKIYPFNRRNQNIIWNCTGKLYR